MLIFRLYNLELSRSNGTRCPDADSNRYLATVPRGTLPPVDSSLPSGWLAANTIRIVGIDPVSHTVPCASSS
jgi:hypothetical protein